MFLKYVLSLILIKGAIYSPEEFSLGAVVFTEVGEIKREGGMLSHNLVVLLLKLYLGIFIQWDSVRLFMSQVLI